MKKTARTLQKEETKALLIRAAYAVFSERGMLGTRVSDVAQAAGVSHGTIFVHFESLEAMIREVVAFYGQSIALRTHVLAQTSGNLQELLRAHLDGIMEFEPFYTRLVIESRLLPADARDSLLAVQSAVSFHLSRALGRCAPEGVSPALLFNLWIGLVHHYLANADLFAPGESVLGRYGDTLIQSYLKLLPKKKEEDPYG